MNAQDYREAKELFVELHELGPEERERRLGVACAERPELRLEVERLIEAHQVEERLESALHAGMASPAALPSAIGGYEIQGLLGEGGMGVVYRAWQESPPRPVALKVLRPGIVTEAAMRRFQHEAELLARLQHRGIATIHDAGVADTGSGPQPFFAMELVEGRPIHEYADADQLDIRARLKLVVEVCRAIEHAHEHGIVHRDIKPGNILVDASGAPKVLDFGIARTTEEGLRTTTLRTRTGELIGTLPYMSPEQLSGDPMALDTRSDVYALGVLTYELLTGELPFQLAGKPLAEAVVVLTECDPAPLSTTRRGARGDLETIVGKALEKERERRYGSATAFAADIQRFLSHEPIVARPPSRLYQLRKFARRNRGLVGGLSAAFITLVVALVLVVGFALEAVDERDGAKLAREMAQDDADTTHAVLEVLTRMIGAPNPAGSWLADRDPYELRVVEVLNSTSAEISAGLGGRPAVELGVRMTLAQTFYGLGMLLEADEQLERVRQLSGEVDEPGSERALKVDELQALLDLRRGQRTLGMAALQRTYDTVARQEGVESSEALRLMGLIAGAHCEMAEFGQAERLLADALELSRSTHGDEALITLALLEQFATLRLEQGQLEESARLAARLLAARERSVEGAHYLTAEAHFLLAKILVVSGRQTEAIPLLRQAIDDLDRRAGPRHPSTQAAGTWLASLLIDGGQLAEAEPLIREMLDDQLEAYGPDHGPALDVRNQLGLCLRGQGKLAEAEDTLRSVYTGNLRVRGRLHVKTASTLGNLGEVIQMQGRDEEAVAMLHEAFEIHRDTLGEGHPETLVSLNNLARCIEGTGRWVESGEYYAELFRLAQEHMSTTGVEWGMVLINYGQSRRLIGRLEEAEASLVEGIEHLVELLGPSDPRVLQAAVLVHGFFRELGDSGAGLELLSSLDIDVSGARFVSGR